MKRKLRNILIGGAALLIFGPVLGWVLTFAGYFHAVQSLAHTSPGAMPDLGQTALQMFVSLIPILLGAVCGAVGFFLISYALIMHFFQSKNDA